VRGSVGAVTLLEQVTALLDASQVPHALIGAAALAAAGIARSTYDLDLLTLDTAVLNDTFWSQLRDDGASVDVRRGDHADPLAGIVRLSLASDRPVDVVVGRHEWQRRAIDRANRLPDGPPIVTPVDLILLKLYAGGAQDLWDVRALLTTPDGAAIACDVGRELEGLAVEMREKWASVQSTHE
jgi:hypothetical protein